MKNYTITVNGNAYDVTVEEKGGSVSAQAPVAAAPKAAPKKAAATGAAGSIKIEAGASGKVFKINATPGTAVKRGEAVLTLEVMKMETPVVAPQDGTVKQIATNKGAVVATGDLLLVI